MAPINALRLPEEELARLSCNPQAVKAHFSRYGEVDSAPMACTYMLGKAGVAQLSTILTDLVTSQLVRPALATLREYEEAALTKWWGPQGKILGLGTVNDLDDEYYLHNPEPAIGDFTTGVNFLIDLIFTAYPELRTHKIRALTNEQSFDATKFGRKSSSGILFMGDRKDPELQQKQYAYFVRHWTKLVPVLSGQRFQKNKSRAIFQDDLHNLLALQKIVLPIHNLLKELPGFSMWKGVPTMERLAARWLKTTAAYFESDYKAMDQYFSRTLVYATVVPVYKAIYHKDDWWMIDHLVDEIFRVPLVSASDIIRCGRHCLFSGLEPTNDWETIASFCINAQTMSEIKLPPLKGYYLPRTMLEYAQIEVVGDDTTVRLAVPHLTITPETKFETRYGHHTIQETFCLMAHLAGLEAALIKQKLSINEFKYCKRWYSRSCQQYRTETGEDAILSIYPLRLMLNSIAFPEYGFLEDPAQETLRILEIMDNAYGHFLWPTFVQRVVKMTEHKLALKIAQLDVDKFNMKSVREWKHLVAGFKFSLDRSPSYQFLTTGKLMPAQPYRITSF